MRRIEERRALIWVKSELWSAESVGDAALSVSDAVEVVAMNGLKLAVRKVVLPMADVDAGQSVYGEVR